MIQFGLSLLDRTFKVFACTHIYSQIFTLCTKFNLTPERISDIHGILKRYPKRKATDLVALNLVSHSIANSLQISDIFAYLSKFVLKILYHQHKTNNRKTDH